MTSSLATEVGGTQHLIEFGYSNDEPQIILSVTKDDFSWNLVFDPTVESIDQWSELKSSYHAETEQTQKGLKIGTSMHNLSFLKYGSRTQISQNVSFDGKDMFSNIWVDNNEFVVVLDQIINYVTLKTTEKSVGGSDDELSELPDLIDELTGLVDNSSE